MSESKHCVCPACRVDLGSLVRYSEQLTWNRFVCPNCDRTLKWDATRRYLVAWIVTLLLIGLTIMRELHFGPVAEVCIYCAASVLVVVFSRECRRELQLKVVEPSVATKV